MHKFYDEKSYKNSMRLRLDYNNMMSQTLGEKGITKQQIESYKTLAFKAFDRVQNSDKDGMTGWMNLPYNQDAICDDINFTAKEIRQNFDNFVVLGIGGSALGPMTAFQALCHLRHNDLPKEKRNAPKFFVEDNVDPERMQALLDVIDIEKTVFNVITKSGATSETMAQYLIINNILKSKLGENANKHIIATTDENKGNLIKLAKAENYKTFFIPSNVGGRFSQLSPVGLLPAAVLGADIKMMLAGAAYMDEICRENNIYKNPALISALLQKIAMDNGKNISVMMPYADSLKFMADWYCQLWGESLGKSVDNDNKVVNVGQTPVKALGVTDQHSQVQLYTEGPYDKVITLLAVDKYRNEFAIPNGADEIPDVSFLGGHSLNELITAERIATEYAFTSAQRLNHTIYLPEVNEFTLGQLFYFFQMETAFCGAMLNIDTYNQPGVEEGKNATYALLGKSGYEKKKKELDSAPPKLEEYIC